MKAPERIYRTKDGRYVPAGDPDAAYLAYPAGAELPGVVASALGLKQASKPADKAAKAAGNKARQRQQPKE